MSQRVSGFADADDHETFTTLHCQCTINSRIGKWHTQTSSHVLPQAILSQEASPMSFPGHFPVADMGISVNEIILPNLCLDRTSQCV